MRFQYNPIIIISTHLKSLSEETNSTKSKLFEDTLKLNKVPYRTCEGVYNSFIENSFILEHNTKTLDLALDAMKTFGQDSILLMDNEGQGTLVYSDGTERVIGTLDVIYDKPSGDYTFISSTKQYFTFS